MILIGLGDGPSLVLTVLVSVDSMNGIRAAIEDESFLRIDAIESQTQRLFNLVHDDFTGA